MYLLRIILLSSVAMLQFCQPNVCYRVKIQNKVQTEFPKIRDIFQYESIHYNHLFFLCPVKQPNAYNEYMSSRKIKHSLILQFWESVQIIK